MSDISGCPVGQVMKTGLIHDSPAAQEFTGSIQFLLLQRTGDFIFPERVSEK